MRILAINWQDKKNPFAGGAEVHLHEILSRLAARGHAITLLCARFPAGADEEHYDGIRIVRRGRWHTFNWSVPAAARTLCHELDVDVIIDDINKIPFYAPRFASRPVLAIVHHLFDSSIFHQVNPVIGSYVYLAESLVPRYYRNVPFMVVSESTRDDLVRRGIKASHVHVVHNGIDLTHYHPDPADPKAEAALLAYVGRLKKYKSIDHLFAALARIRGQFRGVTLQIVGSGDDRERLQAEAQRFGVGDIVHFTGFADLQLKVSIMRRAWLMVCPSRKEGWGLTNIEANACGTPVICADVPGLRDSVREGVTGLLYPYGDIGALAERLSRILRDSAARSRLAVGGLEWAARFSWDEAALATESLLERLVADSTADSGATKAGVSHAP
ncbi:MAG: glycosyltransferase family 4 protein [candidate division Zixibacteria bacterium]|nr:glycosyltransferase family 4 protein [candidate division Zixibacteria bacterium]